MKLIKQISAFVLLAALLLLLPNPVLAGEEAYPELRAEILAALETRQEELNVSQYGVELQEMRQIFNQVRESRLDLWYVDPYCTIWYGSDNTAVKLVFRYMDTEQVTQIQAVLEDAISSCIHSGMTDVQKALALHDYLVLHCAYDTTYSKYEAYNALVEGTSVCQGYAEAYQILLAEVGIESTVVSSQSMNHAWNLVKIDGE